MFERVRIAFFDVFVLVFADMPDKLTFGLATVLPVLSPRRLSRWILKNNVPFSLSTRDIADYRKVFRMRKCCVLCG